MVTGALGGPPRAGRPATETFSIGSWLMSNLFNCASVLPSSESRNGAALTGLPFAEKETEMRA